MMKVVKPLEDLLSFSNLNVVHVCNNKGTFCGTDSQDRQIRHQSTTV